ncbi:MAG: ATP-binding protein [Chitinophagaceae bacterium]
MSLRIRFVLLFTAIAAIILILSSSTIYILYLDHTRNQYKERLVNEAMIQINYFLEKKLNHNDSTDASNNNEITSNALLQRNILIVANDGKIVFADTPNTVVIKPSFELLNNIKNEKYYFQEIANQSILGLYSKREKMYVLISACDVFGIEKVRRLRLILFVVFVGSILTTTTLTYFFVTSALKPLFKLNSQIKETSELNLSQKIDEGNGKDEIGQIAKNYNEMLERLNNAFVLQKNFVHHASHELRTPLTVMFASTEAALKRNLTEADYKQVLTSLKEDQNRLIELTNSLLLLYQFDKLKFTPILHEVRIDELVYDAIGYSKKNFNGITIDFSFENVPEENDLIVEVNDVLLKAAFNNLIKNAFLYSDDKKLNISILATKSILQINFDNRGSQLSESELEDIKKPFSRSENIGLVKGIGLGLSIVEKIVDLHNGKFTYQALPNSVNRFTLELR